MGRLLFAASFLISIAAGAQTFSPPHAFGPVVMGTGLAGGALQEAGAFDGTNYLMVWRDLRHSPDNGDLYAARVTQAGVLLDNSGIAICTSPGDSSSPQVVFDGTNFLVVWSELRSTYIRIYAAHVTPAGQVLEPDGFLIPLGGGIQQLSARVASDGVNALVVWSENVSVGTSVFAANVGTAGVIGAPFALTNESGTETGPAAAWNGSEYLVAWTYSATPGTTNVDVHGIRVSSSGTLLDGAPFPISTASAAESAPVIGSNGATFFVAWNDNRGPDSDIYGTVVTAAGVASSPNGVAVASFAGDQTEPSIAWNGSNYVLGYRDGANLRAARVTATGTVLDPAGVSLNFLGYWQDIACDGVSQCLAAGAFNYPAFDPRFLRFDSALVTLDSSPVGGVRSTAIQLHPVAASDGTNALVVWEEDRGYGDALDVYAVRIGPDGSELPPLYTLGSGPGSQWMADVDFAFGSYLVTWENQSGSLLGQRIAPDGSLVDASPFVIRGSGTPQTGPKLTHGASSWLLAWRAYSTTYDIKAARIAPNGTVLDPGGFLVSGTAATEDSPEVASNGKEFVVAWIANGDVHAARVSDTGAVMDPMDGGLAVDVRPMSQTDVSVASDGRDFLFAWRSDETYPGSIYARRMRADGGFPDPDRLALQATGRETMPTASHDGRTYWVGWQRRRFADNVIEVRGTSITSGGAITTFDGGLWVAAPPDATRPALRGYQRGVMLLLDSEADDDAGVSRGRLRFFQDTAPQGGFCVASSDCKSGFCVDGYCCDSACGGGATDDCLACSEALGSPADGTCAPVSAGFLCRAQVDACDLSERCDGVSPSCPPDLRVQDGGACECEDGGCVGADDGGTDEPDAGSLSVRELKVSCGCSASGGMELMALSLALFAALRRRR